MDLSVTDYVSVLDLIARFNRSLDERDWAGFGAFFTEDAVMTFSQDTLIEGQSAIVDIVRTAEEGNYALNFHMGAGFTTDSVAQDRIAIDVPVLGFGVFLPEKSEGLRFSGARSKWILLREDRGWRIAESHHRMSFAGAAAAG